ncbi:TonB-dependent receptor [Hyunsoonleella sp. SJ7]|uniref:TonB-dependent receptor n=1 Tax=Hyunsoonleella aquatilis TaxID=2762758 RepID=A0A923HD05_9FLAO|nr:TonB-dependent receptor [Hyunsoonleella aquatilis]MBC3759209.1 TonB-dependent receptor [Hyunsoonleella aquatilis]
MKKLKLILGVFCSVAFSIYGYSSTVSITEITKLDTTATMEISKETQTIEVSGTVSDTEGPLPGVNILVKGSSKGTQTDFDGNFSISVENEKAVLIFSYVGYKTQEITVGNKTSINVILEADIAGLDEVVVVGYSTKTRGELTGSVSTIGSEAIEQSSSKDVAKSLAGRASGLIISDRGGYPGAGNGAGGNTNDDATTILIRGKSTLGNNSPLILIDGIPSGSFSQLAPQDIASLTVLKDGAAAIYGSRAANGVILITTKRGKSGKPKINFSSTLNFSSFTVRPSLMSSEQFAIYRNEIAERNGDALPFTQEEINNYASGSDPLNFPNTDWVDLTFADTAPESRNSLSISGGTENVKYFVSGDFIDQKGMYRSRDLGFKQHQLRTNIDVNITDNFKFGVDVAGRFGKTEEPGVNDSNIYKLIFTIPPTEIGVYPNGLPARGGDEGNPVITSSNASGFVKTISNTLTSRFTVDWGLDSLLEGLSVKGFAGLRRLNNDTKSWYTPWTYYVPDGSGGFDTAIGSNQQGTLRTLRESFWKFDEQIYNARLHYSNVFGDHSVNAFIGMERLNSNTRNFFAEKRGGFPDPGNGELFQGSTENQASNGSSSEFARQDYFGSLSYDFQKKYFIDLTIRHDGSSNFGPGNRFGTFPSVAVSWALHKESFMENISWLDALKIRASWSEMGNDRIGPNQFLSLFDYGTDNGTANPLNAPIPNYYVFGENGTFSNAYRLARIANPDITWETADMKNLGFNFSLFGNRLNGDINYFYQKRSGILITRGAEIPDFIGLTGNQLPAENLGVTKNFGFEFELSWADRIGKVDYNIGANFSQARNEVVFLAEPANVSPFLKREGRPIDSYIVYPTAGIFRDQAQVDATDVKLDGTVEGEPIYLDTDDDGSIGAGDRVRTDTSNIPEIQYGIYGGLNYQGFNFNFLLQGQAEAETLVFFDQDGAKPDFVFNNRWTPNNRNASYPRAFAPGDQYSGVQSEGPTSDVNAGFQGADLYYQDASFLRLKEVELGYTLTKEKIKLGDLKIFVRGFNLLTMFSDIYDMGLDPEATGYNNFRSATYTPLKTYTVGLNFSF